MIELEGQLVEIIFSNDTNGYTVASLLFDEDEVTIVGYMPTVKIGDKLALKGKWTMHPIYGQQLEVNQYRLVMPSTENEIVSYLSSGMIPGVGEKMAKRIVDHFGLKTIEILTKSPEKLLEVSGIGKSKLVGIKEAFLEQHELREIILFLNKYNIPTNYGVKIYKKYGGQTIDIIQENPYRLAEEIRGIGFKTADEIARTLGIPFDSKYRVYAGTRYIINAFNLEGHTYIPGEILVERAKKLLNVKEDLIEEAVQYLALDQKIQLERLCDEIIVYSMPYYYAETNVCKKIIELSKVELDEQKIDKEKVIEELESVTISLAKKQREAILQAVENGILVITGGPGTGKTTTVNTLIKVFEKFKLKVILGAPTGRAAKRMTEATGKEAKTIHRLLELGYVGDDVEMTFNRNEENPLDCDVLIIDEVSMVDILLMNSLLKAIARGTRVILVGDVDQLPSVGAGNVLRDIIESNIVKVVKLDEIFRQAQESMIIVNAHKINQGLYPELNVKDKDFFFMSRFDEDKLLNTLVELTTDRLPKHYKIDPMKDIQILAPMKKGRIGTVNLNKQLQQYLNPPNKNKKEKTLKEKLFRIGDKVMQIKNNYTLKWHNIDPDAIEQRGEGIFNGDIGYVFDIDKDEDKLTIVFDECRLVEYDFSQLDEIELAYCVTIHKSQGSEFPVVVIPMGWGPPMLLTRNLLYTAVTRAKSLVVLVGNEKYLKSMVDNNQITTRYSGLDFRLKKFHDFHMNIKNN
ncbi:ATP-dependent RecD-like DNA helicase [Serpentinicella alkaliphila]|uniref:ATP-dependent RecD2 DNA helicase n=1 Tax=Serpentinicella alkaliphila TaxID=1734049 RepID=A0A4V2T3U7_9FIRM|nr:ATP-dependent RecD-like DNA helicase [Serpentinicella alkaliphila]QUH24932.1 ATP-dependent RecD-like DNA helicase [Serpentinicella alkaliphila]TCQ02734.1 exodeoxyribonuclease V alpha subunit [Serpentinicella alkaliphila]